MPTTPSTTAAHELPHEPKLSWKVWWIWCTVLTVSVGLAFIADPQAQREDLWALLFIGPFGATFYYGGYVAIRRFLYRITYRQAQSLNLTQKTEALQEELEKDFFTNLVRINFKYLDKYYLQTQEQGDKSFLLSAAAAVVGLLIIIAGITLMFFDKTNPAYLTTAVWITVTLYHLHFF